MTQKYLPSLIWNIKVSGRVIFTHIGVFGAKEDIWSAPYLI